MTFEQYWQLLVGKNPALIEAEKMTITVISFKAQMQRAFETGQQQKQSQGFEDLLNALTKGLNNVQSRLSSCHYQSR